MNRKTGVILSYILMIFEVLSTLLLTPFIIRTLGQAEYGVYKLSAAITVYLLLLDLGVGNAVVKFSAQFRVNGDKEQSRKLLGVTTLFYVLIALIVVIIGAILVLIFPTAFSTGLNNEEILLGQKLLGITIVNAAITLGTTAYINFIIAHEKFIIEKGFSIFQILVRIVLTFIALKLGFGSMGIVSVNLLITIVSRCFFIFYVIFGLKIKPKFKGVQFSFIKEIIFYSSWILLQAIATQINAFVDQIIFGVIVPTSAIIIGIYGIGSQIIQYYQTIGSSFTGVLMPGVVRMVEKNADAKTLCDEMIRIGRMIFMVLALILVCFIIYGKQFIMLWVGSENVDSFIVAMILMPVYLFLLTESIGTQILWARNEHKEQAILKFIIVIINVFLTIVLINWKPLIGATIGTAISLILGDIVIMNVIFKKKLKISLKEYYLGLFKGILPCLFITFICGLGFSLLRLDGWLGFVCNIIVMIIIYIILMICFGFNKYEKDLLKSLLGKIFKKRKGNQSNIN